MARRRQTREEKKARTRAQLVAAARRVFGRRGFHGASLEEIADAAGLTTGAIYSNFSGKEELFLAVFEDHIAQRLQSTQRAMAAGCEPEERARAAGDEWMAFLRANPEWFPLFVEFWSFAVRDPKLRGRFAEQYRRFSDANAAFLAEGARELGIELPPEIAERAGILISAVADGLALLRLANPDAIPEDLFADFLALLVRPELVPQAERG